MQILNTPAGPIEAQAVKLGIAINPITPPVMRCDPWRRDETELALWRKRPFIVECDDVWEVRAYVTGCDKQIWERFDKITDAIDMIVKETNEDRIWFQKPVSTSRKYDWRLDF